MLVYLLKTKGSCAVNRTVRRTDTFLLRVKQIPQTLNAFHRTEEADVSLRFVDESKRQIVLTFRIDLWKKRASNWTRS